MRKRFLSITMGLAVALSPAVPTSIINTVPVVNAATQCGEWSADRVYNTGDVVSYQGQYWEAQWYTQNDVPGTTGQWGVWQEVTDGSATPAPSTTPSQPSPSPSQPSPSPSPTQSGSTTPTDAQSYMNKMKPVTDCPSSASDRQAGVSYSSAVKKTYFSSTTQTTRSCNVILPANYSPSKKYPVVYYLHGIFGNEDSMLGNGNGTIEIPANLAKEGKAKEMIIVCPDIYAPAPGKSVTPALNQAYFDGYDNFINDLTNDLMPFIEQNYSVATGRENTGVCGFSMGGRTALYIGYAKPELFGYVGAFSPAPGVTPGTDYSGYHKGLFTEDGFRIQNPAVRPYVTLICSGTNDSVVGTFPKSYHEILTRNSQPHVWVEVSGADHDARAIRTGFYNFVSSAFGVLN